MTGTSDRPGQYGSDGAAIWAGMTLIHACEGSDRGPMRLSYATVPRGSRRDVCEPFELTSRACAGEGEVRPACEGFDTKLFFPEDFRAIEPDELAVIRRICFACPRRAACAEAGANEPDGIWGGLTPRERAARRKNKRAAS